MSTVRLLLSFGAPLRNAATIGAIKALVARLAYELKPVGVDVGGWVIKPINPPSVLRPIARVAVYVGVRSALAVPRERDGFLGKRTAFDLDDPDIVDRGAIGKIISDDGQLTATDRVHTDRAVDVALNPRVRHLDRRWIAVERHNVFAVLVVPRRDQPSPHHKGGRVDTGPIEDGPHIPMMSPVE